jgi:transketolase C-terminal domain/subunit
MHSERWLQNRKKRSCQVVNIAITIQEHPFMAGFGSVIARHKAQQTP